MDYALIQKDGCVSPVYGDRSILHLYDNPILHSKIDRFFDGDTYHNPDPKAHVDYVVDHLSNTLNNNGL